MFGVNHQLEDFKKIAGIMKNFDDNVKYFFDVVSKKTRYLGKFVVVDNKKVIGVYDDEKMFLETLTKIDKSAYASCVPKQNEIIII